MESAKGLLQVFTGNGKGKTSAALGLAFRALGRGLKVLMVQFMKAPESSGEHFSAQAFEDKLTIRPLGRTGFIVKRGCDPLDSMLARRALYEAKNEIESGEYDVVILDEIFVALHMNLLELEEVIDFIDNHPNIELVMTGRNAPPEILERADLVTEFHAAKHYLDRGVKARLGFEY